MRPTRSSSTTPTTDPSRRSRISSGRPCPTHASLPRAPSSIRPGSSRELVPAGHAPRLHHQLGVRRSALLATPRRFRVETGPFTQHHVARIACAALRSRSRPCSPGRGCSRSERFRSPLP
jgi:hypothetical protein